MYSRGAQQYNYLLRLMACMALALLLVIVCFKIPFQQKPRPVGWANQRFAYSEGFTLIEQFVQEVPQISWQTQTTPTGSVAERNIAVSDEHISIASMDSSVTKATPEIATQKLPVLDYAELMPAIPGGIGAYYVHIEYPQEAIEQGIEGLLQLTFTVNTDGSTSNIQVTSPLHPLCDSAAVQALRRTSFIPGQNNGRSVRVRMRLPVRFQLIDPTPESEGTLPRLTSEGAPQ